MPLLHMNTVVHWQTLSQFSFVTVLNVACTTCSSTPYSTLEQSVSLPIFSSPEMLGYDVDLAGVSAHQVSQLAHVLLQSLRQDLVPVGT